MKRVTGIVMLIGLLGCDGFAEPEPVSNVLPQVSDTIEQGIDVSFDDPAGTFPEEGMAFRMDQLKITQLGSQDAEGFITQLLDSQWALDVSEYKLNIVLVVHSLDEVSGDAEVSVGFGVGADATSLCLDELSRTGITTAKGDGLEFTLGYDFASVYSEDDDGTSFNCTPDPQVPDGVPLRQVSGVMKVALDADEQWASASGYLGGCLSHAEGEKLCSCVGSCSGPAHESCGGCPDGSAPLTTRLGNIVPTEKCTSKLGEDAYDLNLDFEGIRIPVPPVCP